ncbi:MAG TPA: TRAP transporter small permease [Burkholderiales bacterium]|nr:TRAP transporter small permease [Burkholderiales bacterium]
MKDWHETGADPRDWRGTAAKVCGWAAAAFLAAMMLLTVADVALRALLNTPIRGVVELVELCLACTFFLALPASFLRSEHLVVDVIDGLAPRRVPLLKRASGVLAVIVLAVLGWQSWLVAQDSIAFGDVTSDLALPRILYWIPVLTGIIGSGIAALAMLLRRDGRA